MRSENDSSRSGHTTKVKAKTTGRIVQVIPRRRKNGCEEECWSEYYVLPRIYIALVLSGHTTKELVYEQCTPAKRKPEWKLIPETAVFCYGPSVLYGEQKSGTVSWACSVSGISDLRVQKHALSVLSKNANLIKTMSPRVTAVLQNDLVEAAA
ncbi:uncharacterized protein LOC143185981 [Calliopsis andreniformis]|uniref:uncharacterized protein LOC143185981 n=1 Tax=Calliopsis andreniformis TaxID=337506 RepID=UPI003FCDB619